MQKKFKPYPSDKLPDGFVYPKKYLEFSEGGDYPSLYPWWFVDADSEAGTLFYSIRNRDGRNLIPFAKVDDDRGDIACFDGDDTSGDPSVLMQVNDDSGRSYSFENFDDWLLAAKKDASNM
jgi:hypothetical protein